MPEHCSITLPFADSSHETICAYGHGNCAILRRLAFYLRLSVSEEECATPTIELSEEAPSQDGGWQEWTSVTGFKGTIRWKPSELRFHFHIPPAKRYALIPILKRAYNLAAFRRTLLGRTIFVHGALLYFTETNEAAVLFGHCGIGKSTACERFKSQGGEYLSDDKMLLSFMDDGSILAQPSPTWSRYGIRELDVPFATAVPVSSMMWLSRGEGDRIHAADAVQWRLTLVKSFSNVLEYPCNWLPPSMIHQIMDKATSFLPTIAARFGTYELAGDLNGSIHDNLKAFAASAKR